MIMTKNAEKDADELFKKYTIPEIRSYHADLGRDVKAKKQELRNMVGCVGPCVKKQRRAKSIDFVSSIVSDIVT